MTELSVVSKQEVLGREFTVYGTIKDPLFLAKDVAEWIEYEGRTGQLLESVDEDEKLMHKMYASGQNREMWFLTENGLYEVLMLSRKPIAKQFKKEVKKVLRSLRLNGGYIADQESLTPEQVVANALIVANKIIEDMKNRVDVAEKALDRIANGKGCFGMNQTAKALKLPYGDKTLYKVLIEQGILNQDKSPRQEQANAGRFKVVIKHINDFVGNKPVTLTTGKGLVYLAKKFNATIDESILPDYA